MNICPVCAYNKLEFPPTNYTICACCGTEFGYDDRVVTHSDLTRNWVVQGCPWFDEDEQKPVGWNAYMQLIAGGLGWAVPKFAESIELQANLTIEGAGIQFAESLWNLQSAA